MNNNELINKINEIIFSVPDEIYKFKKPKYCFQVEWDEATSKEKAFLLLKEMIMDINKEKSNEKDAIVKDQIEIELGKCPRFYSHADENMFFNAIYSIASYVKIVGCVDKLHLYCNNSITKEEVQFLINLLKRYQVDIPKSLLQRIK